MKILCFGDSITESGRDGGWLDWLRTQLAPCHEIYEAAVGGNTTMQALERYAQDVTPVQADLVIVEFGINDCYVRPHLQIERHSRSEYARNLREIIRLIQAEGAIPVLIINHPLKTEGVQHPQGNGTPLEHSLDRYNETARCLADELKIRTIDLPRNLNAEMTEKLLAEDKVHLSTAGQLIYGRIILDGLRPFTDSNLVEA